MKRLLLLLLLPCLVWAVDPDDLETMRWQILSDCHISVSGTDQISTAYVDSTINAYYQDMATLDLYPCPYADWDSIGTVQGTFLYDLPSDIIEGGLLWCIKYSRDDDDNLQTIPMPIFPLPDVTVPEVGAPAKYVMALYGQFYIHPIPVDPDTFVICYRAVPPKLTGAASPLLMDYRYRQMIVWRVDAAVKRKQGRFAEAMAFELLWTEAKLERTVTKTTSEEIIE